MNLRGMRQMTIGTIEKTWQISQKPVWSNFVYAFRNRFQANPAMKNRVAVKTMAEPETILK